MPLSQFEVECREGSPRLALWDIQPFADESGNLVSIGGFLRTLLCRGSFARRFSEVRFDHGPGTIRVVGVYEAPCVNVWLHSFRTSVDLGPRSSPAAPGASPVSASVV